MKTVWLSIAAFALRMAKADAIWLRQASIFVHDKDGYTRYDQQGAHPQAGRNALLA